jgi:hypothetical protein
VNRKTELAVVMLTLAAGVVSFGQDQTKKEKRQAATERVVQGTVYDAGDKAVNGAVVQLKDERTLQVRSFITQKDGGYHFSGLKVDNDYQLKADFNGVGSGWKTLSVFDTRKEPIINLKMDKPDKAEKPEKNP